MYSYSKDFFYKKGSLGGGFSVQSIIRTTDNSSSLQLHSDTQLGGTTTMTSEEKEEIYRLKNLVVPFGLVHSAIKKNGKGIEREREMEFGEEEREDDYINERVHTLLLAMADENKIKSVKHSKKNSSVSQTKKNKRYMSRPHSRKMSRRVGK